MGESPMPHDPAKTHGLAPVPLDLLALPEHSRLWAFIRG